MEKSVPVVGLAYIYTYYSSPKCWLQLNCTLFHS